MIEVTVAYPAGQGRTFNMDYYLKTHIPLFQKRMGAAMKMSEESNSKQPNPNTMPVPKTMGVTMARAGGWWSFAAP